jgi:acetoin:2,6-dichlorophenolindophenol oxidoreductase subunit beta
MTKVTYREAVISALRDELQRDAAVVLLGEDIGASGGVFKATEGLFEEFGSLRVRDTPISEQAIVGAAIGAAITGLRPVAELMFADFAGVAFDQIANQMAKYRYMTGGQVKVPVTVRMATGSGLGFAAQHSQPAENWFLNVPGLHVVVPGTPSDVIGLLKAAIRSDDPVLFFEHKALYNRVADIDVPGEVVAIGSGDVVIEGTDITCVAIQLMRQRVVEAVTELTTRGISLELIDPRCLVPFDFEIVRNSLTKTRRLMVVQESPFAGSWGATLVARVAMECPELLSASPIVLSAPDTPIPFAGNLEDSWAPSVDSITAAATALAGSSTHSYPLEVP